MTVLKQGFPTASLGNIMSWIEKVSKQLDLTPVLIDWGICNANPLRLEEFIAFCMQHSPNESMEYEELADLVLESAAKSIEDGTFTMERKKLVVDFIREKSDLFPIQLNYWLTFESKEICPILPVVKEAADA